ncbi:MAG: GFA family protein, partial [Hyphomonadaceae bacterium]
MTRPPIPAPPFAGGCLCGAVRYRIEARPKAVNACHCMDCKKLTGGAHLLMLLVDHDAFLHERGEIHTFRKLADSGREIDIVRCARCGVRMWHAPLV